MPGVIGERFLLRDHAETTLLGGGRILDPFAPRHGKAHRSRLAYLGAIRSGLQAGTLSAAIDELVAQNLLVDVDRSGRAGISARMNGATWTWATPACSKRRTGRWLTSEQHWRASVSTLSGHIDTWHRENRESRAFQPTSSDRSWHPHWPRPYWWPCWHLC